MSPALIAGIVIGIFGMIMAGDAKTFGMKTPAAGIAVAAAGGFLALFGMYGATQGGNNGGGSGRKVKDYTV
jgi:hypothetical protein